MSVHAPHRLTLRETHAARRRARWPFDVARGLTAAGVLLSADVHFDLWYAGGFRELSTIGPLFLLNSIGGLVVGVALVCWRHWLPPLAAVGFGAATLSAFWVSVTVGLFGLKEIATGEPELLAEGAEIAAIVFGALALWLYWRERRAGRRGP